MEVNKYYQVLSKVLDVFAENNCSIEDIQELIGDIIPTINKCTTLHKQNNSYFDTISEIYGLNQEN